MDINTPGRTISGAVLKWRNGFLVIRDRYEAKQGASSGFSLTGPTPLFIPAPAEREVEVDILFELEAVDGERSAAGGESGLLQLKHR